MTKVLVLGATGMLGSAVANAFVGSKFELLTASRTSGLGFDAESLEIRSLFKSTDLSSEDFVINCVGLTKSRIDETSLASRSSAVRLNVDFPAELARVAEASGVKVVQVATDCVFSGQTGNYTESSPHDPLDVYGKTKSLGEVPSTNVMHLRCSLIGPELGRNSLFFEWVRQQPSGAQISGYTDHLWNGLTSRAFGEIARGIIQNGLFKAGVQHLVPADRVTKDELVRMQLALLGRDDVRVASESSGKTVDRTLQTNDPNFNSTIFSSAGFSRPPTIAEMLKSIV